MNKREEMYHVTVLAKSNHWNETGAKYWDDFIVDSIKMF